MAKRKNWSHCQCKDCGYEWNAGETEHFNISFCDNCHGFNIGGKYHEPSNPKTIKKETQPKGSDAAEALKLLKKAGIGQYGKEKLQVV